MIEQNKIKPGYNKERYFTFKCHPAKPKRGIGVGRSSQRS
jgi:hypothetical protein